MFSGKATHKTDLGAAVSTDAPSGSNPNNANNNGNHAASAAYEAATHTESVDDTPTALLEQLVYVDNFLQGGNDNLTNESPNFEEQLSAELAAFADDEFIFPDEEKPQKKRGDGDDGGSNNNGNGNGNGNNGANGWEYRDAAGISSNDPFFGTGGGNGAGAGNQNGLSPIPSTIHELLGRRDSGSNPNAAAGDFANGTIHGAFDETGSPAVPQTVSGAAGSVSANPVGDVQQMLPRVQIPQGAQSTLAAAGLSQTQIEALATLILYHKQDLIKIDPASANNQNGTVGGVAIGAALNGLGLVAGAGIGSASASGSGAGATGAGATGAGAATNASVAAGISALDAVSAAAQNGAVGVDSPLSKHAELLAQSLLGKQVYGASIPPGIATSFSATAQTFPLPVDRGASSGEGMLEGTSNSKSSDQRSPVSSSVSPETGSSLSSQRKRKNTTTSPSAVSTPSDKADADKDKRRRNTAASARFRIKKKLKEQEMEQSLKNLGEVSKNLELKVQQLEMENRLLRNLVIEKNQQRDSEEVERLKKRARMSVKQEGFKSVESNK